MLAAGSCVCQESKTGRDVNLTDRHTAYSLARPVPFLFIPRGRSAGSCIVKRTQQLIARLITPKTLSTEISVKHRRDSQLVLILDRSSCKLPVTRRRSSNSCVEGSKWEFQARPSCKLCQPPVSCLYKCLLQRQQADQLRLLPHLP